MTRTQVDTTVRSARKAYLGRKARRRATKIGLITLSLGIAGFYALSRAFRMTDTASAVGVLGAVIMLECAVLMTIGITYTCDALLGFPSEGKRNDRRC